MRLAVIGDGVAITVDHKGGIVVLRVGRPAIAHVDRLRIAGDDGAIMLESRCAHPQRADARVNLLQVRRDIAKRLEIVACRRWMFASESGSGNNMTGTIRMDTLYVQEV